MSTYWFPYCKTCKTDDHRCVWWNHGVDRGMAALIQVMPDLGRFARALAAATGPLDIDVKVSGPEWTNGLLEFAAKHGDHEIVAKNEYGQFDTQCRERWTCNGGHLHDCDLDLNHEGPHGPKGSA